MTARTRTIAVALRRAALAAVAATWLAGAAMGEPHLALPAVVVLPPDATELSSELTEALANALRSHGGFQVTLVADADADADGATARAVRDWALDTGSDAVVVARLEAGQLWTELRSAHSGGLLGGWTVAPQLEPAAVTALQAGIREALGAPPLDGTAAATLPPGSASEGVPLIGSLRPDGPISIKSEQLDVASSNGKRHLVFKRDVRVLQGDIELRTEKLEAFYEAGQSQPEKLIAIGDVRVIQGERVARCDRATYLRAEQRIVCSGHASVVRGCDVVRGGRIEFDLEYEHFTVMGAASVVLAREDEACGAGGRS